MTVRDATRRESPDGHVLYIEQLRSHLGIRSGVGETSFLSETPRARPEVILIGHDMHGDFKSMAQAGIDLRSCFRYTGCLDTQVVIEDTDAYMGKSLSSLVSYYDLAKLEWKKPGCGKIPGKWVFIGSHCAGNDAIMTLGSGIAQALDLTLRTPGHNSLDEGDFPDDWLDNPLPGMNTNMVLLAYDTEIVETPNYKPNILNRTSEHGFAWLRLADIAHVAPGKDGCNWRRFIHASHWINQDFRNFKNWFYCVGNPKGFWPQYGKSQYYRVSEGPAPFHKLFGEIASPAAGTVEGSDTIEEATKLLEKTTLREKASVVEDSAADTRGRNPLVRGTPGRGRGGFGRSAGGGRGKRGKHRGGNSKF